jgi:hypothetical protein
MGDLFFHILIASTVYKYPHILSQKHTQTTRSNISYQDSLTSKAVKYVVNYLLLATQTRQGPCHSTWRPRPPSPALPPTRGSWHRRST